MASVAPSVAEWEEPRAAGLSVAPSPEPSNTEDDAQSQYVGKKRERDKNDLSFVPHQEESQRELMQSIMAQRQPPYVPRAETPSTMKVTGGDPGCTRVPIQSASARVQIFALPRVLKCFSPPQSGGTYAVQDVAVEVERIVLGMAQALGNAAAQRQAFRALVRLVRAHFVSVCEHRARVSDRRLRRAGVLAFSRP